MSTLYLGYYYMFVTSQESIILARTALPIFLGRAIVIKTLGCIIIGGQSVTEQ